MIRAAFTGLAIALAGGCASDVFEAERLTAVDGKVAAGEGVAYGLPKFYVPVTLERTKTVANKKTTYAFTMTVADEPIVAADPNHLYRLKYLHNAGSAADVDIKVDEFGLLNEVTSKTKDALPETLKDLGDFLVGVATSGVSTAFSESLLGDAAPALADEPFKITIIIDPSNAESWEKHAAFLAERNASLGVNPLAEMGAADADVETNCAEMLCYRTPLPYEIAAEDKTAKVTEAAVILAPNEGPVSGIEVRRRALVENTLTLDFEKGVLLQAHYEDPSAAEAAVSIPINLAKSIVSIPSALFRFTVASDTEGAKLEQQKSLLTAQKELLTEQIALEAKRKELEQ